MSGRPGSFVNWCPDGSPTKIQQPTTALSNQGYVSGQKPIFTNFNYIVYLLDQWVQYLDGANAVAGAVNTIFNSVRLINGGFWSWNAGTTTLKWTSAFNLAMPGIADSVNQIAAGTAVIPSGSVAYVNANIPYVTTGTTNNGSTQVTSIAEPSGIVAGDSVQGAGIPNGTTVSSISGTTVTLSQNATATGTAVPLTFTPQATPTVQVAAESSFLPASNSIIIARSLGADCIVGVGSGQMKMRDNETKGLLDNGYVTILSVTAGVALTQGQAVYISNGNDGNTEGNAYLVDASAANGALRGQFIGFVATSAAAGATVKIATGGQFPYTSALSAGFTYYVDPTNPGAITKTVPSVTNTYSIPVGVAIDSSRIQINSGVGMVATLVQALNPWPQYAAGSEAQLVTALANVVTNGGGIVTLTGPFSLSTLYTLPNGCVLLGRKNSSLLSVSSNGAGIVLADGSEMQDIWFNSTQTAGVVVAMSGNYGYMHECKIAVTPSSTTRAIYVSGSMNKMVRNQINGVLFSSTAYGIDYTGGGIDNIDDGTLYTG